MIHIIPPTLFFVLSLIGTYVLFKILKSKATINERKKLIRGALAGFLILFVSLTQSFYFLFLHDSISITEYSKRIEEYERRIREIKETWEPQVWTVSGYIIKENSTAAEQINVNYFPPSPGINYYPVQRRFHLYNVKICKADQWPTVQFTCEGYYPEDYQISPGTADINEKYKSIKLKNEIRLTKIN